MFNSKNLKVSFNEDEESYISKTLNQSLNQGGTKKSREKKNKISNILSYFLLFKKLMFVFLLLSGGLANFSILNLTYFALGIFFIYNFNEDEEKDLHRKNLILLLCAISAIFGIIFKIVIYVLYKNGKIAQNDSAFYINFGLMFFLQNQNNFIII